MFRVLEKDFANQLSTAVCIVFCCPLLRHESVYMKSSFIPSCGDEAHSLQTEKKHWIWWEKAQGFIPPHGGRSISTAYGSQAQATVPSPVKPKGRCVNTNFSEEAGNVFDLLRGARRGSASGALQGINLISQSHNGLQKAAPFYPRALTAAGVFFSGKTFCTERHQYHSVGGGERGGRGTGEPCATTFSIL